jgi:hypothetical protein
MGIGTPSITNRHDLIRHPSWMLRQGQWATPAGFLQEGGTNNWVNKGGQNPLLTP